MCAKNARPLRAYMSCNFAAMALGHSLHLTFLAAHRRDESDNVERLAIILPYAIKLDLNICGVSDWSATSVRVSGVSSKHLACVLPNCSHSSTSM